MNDHYWNRWRREYLSELCERHKLINVIPDRQIKLNEVVIIEETHVPRTRWKIGPNWSLLRANMDLIVNVNYA